MRCACETPPTNACAAPLMLNLELTTRCPLNCPQCYCDLEGGKDLAVDRAIEVLGQAAALGTKQINLSGGETMVYPHLHELLAECKRLGLVSAVALSGYGIDKESLKKLIDSGVDEIYVSLNGSSEAVSRKSRDGHVLAIRALELLAASGFKNTAINWVAQRSNIADFPQLAALGKDLGIKALVVMAYKPDSSYQMEAAPDGGQTRLLVEDIKRLRQELAPMIIEVESCYSPLRALLGQKFFLNINTGMAKGCGAGRDGASLDVDGHFTPCRHLDFAEAYHDLKDYWYDSPILEQLRCVEAAPESPCTVCKYDPYCLSCLAVNVKMNGRIAKGNAYCNLWENI